MNKKSQLIILKIMLAVTILIIAMILAKPTKDIITDTTNSTSLNCTSEVLTATENATCVVLDSGIFYFIATVLGIGLAIFTGNRTINGIMTAIFVYIVVAMLIEPIKSLIIIFRDSSHLNCANTAISTGTKMACIVVDAWMFWFVALALGTAVTLFLYKKGIGSTP